MPHTPEHILEQTPEQRQAAFQAAGLTPQQQTQVKTGVPSGFPAEFITADSLAPVITPKIEPVTPIKTPDVSGLPTTEPKPIKPEVGTDFNQRLEESLAKIEGRSKERETKVATIQEQRELNEINLQIRMHQAASLKSEEEALQRGETLSFASGEAQRVARNNAVKALELSALAQAKQGNLALATDLATSAIEEKYKEQERNLKIQRANIVNNYDTFTAAQKKRADATLLKIDKEDAFVKQQKDKEKSLQEIGNKAAVAGAPLSSVREAIATGDTVKASSLLAPFLQKEPTGDIAEFKTFFPNVDVTTPAGQQQFLNWKARAAAAGREPKEKLGVEPSRAADQLTFLRNTTAEAKKLAGASGRSGARKTFESWFVGSTNYTKLESLTNTLRTNVLSLMTDPDIKKFFGPQMSDADVRLMTAAGTTLNPELQGPKEMTNEITRLDNLLNRMQTAVRLGKQGTSNVITAPDGTQIEIID